MPLTRPPSATALRFTAIVAVAAIAGCNAGSPSASPTASAASAPQSPTPDASPGGPPTDALEDVATFDVEYAVAPDWPALLADSLWVLVPDGDDPAVLRLDPSTGDEQARISLPGGTCEGIAAGFGSIWACAPDGMVRIDPASNTIAATVAFQRPPEWFGRPAVGEDAVWMGSGEVVADTVVRIDPATNAVTGTYPVGHTVSQLAYGLGYLWVTSTNDGLLLRVDPASGAVATVAEDLVDPYTVTTGAGRVWVGLQWVGTDDVDPDPSVPDLFRFDPSAGSGDFFDYGMRPQTFNDMGVTDDAAWIQGTDPFLFQVDPESGAIEWVIASDRGSGAIAIAGDVLWLTLWRDNAVLRIDL
jgi:hypothetical protein